MTIYDGFTCLVCNSEFARETVDRECRVCYRNDCNECLDEKGVCIPCKE